MRNPFEEEDFELYKKDQSKPVKKVEDLEKKIDEEDIVGFEPVENKENKSNRIPSYPEKVKVEDAAKAKKKEVPKRKKTVQKKSKKVKIDLDSLVGYPLLIPGDDEYPGIEIYPTLTPATDWSGLKESLYENNLFMLTPKLLVRVLKFILDPSKNEQPHNAYETKRVYDLLLKGDRRIWLDSLYISSGSDSVVYSPELEKIKEKSTEKLVARPRPLDPHLKKVKSPEKLAVNPKKYLKDFYDIGFANWLWSASKDGLPTRETKDRGLIYFPPEDKCVASLVNENEKVSLNCSTDPFEKGQTIPAKFSVPGKYKVK